METHKTLCTSDGWESRLAQTVPIERVIARYVQLKAGKNGLLVGPCPFHAGGPASLVVFRETGRYVCFGCGAGGDAIDFIAALKNLSYTEAATRFAEWQQIRLVLPEEEFAPYYRVMALAAKFYREELRQQPGKGAVKRYLSRRKVDQATCDAYGIGYSPDGWDALTSYLTDHKVPLELAEEVGLVKKGNQGGYYDFFRGRLMFTIKDAAGRPIAFGGRVLDDSSPKYINSEESPIYRKSEVLFGLDLARPALLQKKAAVVVEGYFDHLALWQAGVTNVVASCGTALTPEHVATIGLYADRVYTLFDSDKAGLTATLNAVKMFVGADLPVKVIELDPGEDPDSFLKNEGLDAFADRVRSSVPGVVFALQDAMKKVGKNRREAAREVASLLPLAARCNDDVKAAFVKAAATACQAPEALFSSRIGL